MKINHNTTTTNNTNNNTTSKKEENKMMNIEMIAAELKNGNRTDTISKAIKAGIPMSEIAKLMTASEPTFAEDNTTTKEEKKMSNRTHHNAPNKEGKEMTIEMINQIMGTHYVLEGRNGRPSGNARLMKTLKNITAEEIMQFMATDEGWNMSSEEKHAKGYHGLRALYTWYKAKGKTPKAQPKAPKKAPKAEPKFVPTPEPKDEPKPEPKKKAPKAKGDPKELTSDIEKKLNAMLDMQNEGKPVNIYLHGPAGTGKSYSVKQVANFRNAGYYQVGSITMKEELLGYSDANGNFVEPMFLRIIRDGIEGYDEVIVLIDEMDAIPNAAFLALNDIFANRMISNSQGVYKVHDSVRFIATGNTTLDGSDENYDRENTDKSIKTRWIFQEVKYDKNLEKKLARPEIVRFLQGVRKAADTKGLNLLVTYREFTALEWFVPLIEDGTFTREQALNSALFKGLTDDDKEILRRDAMIQRLISEGNEWAQAI